MVGGGFGGSIIALARRGAAKDVASRVLEDYGGGGHLVAIVP
jgi:galactokinase